MLTHKLGIAADTALVQLKQAIYPQTVTFNNLTLRDRIINMNETIEEMYKGVFAEYENITAARGCNQYKHMPGCDEAGKESNPDTKYDTYLEKRKQYKKMEAEISMELKEFRKKARELHPDYSGFEEMNIIENEIPGGKDFKKKHDEFINLFKEVSNMHRELKKDPRINLAPL